MTVQRSVLVVHADVADAAQPGERLGRRPAPPKSISSRCSARSLSVAIDSTASSRPSRMIPTRSQRCSTSGSWWDEMKTVRPSSRASSQRRSNSSWTNGSRPAVGSSRIEQLGPGHEGGDQADLLLVAARQALDLLRRVELERARSASRGSRVDAALEVAEVGEQLARRSGRRRGPARPGRS